MYKQVLSTKDEKQVKASGGVFAEDINDEDYNADSDPVLQVRLACAATLHKHFRSTVLQILPAAVEMFSHTCAIRTLSWSDARMSRLCVSVTCDICSSRLHQASTHVPASNLCPASCRRDWPLVKQCNKQRVLPAKQADRGCVHRALPHARCAIWQAICAACWPREASCLSHKLNTSHLWCARCALELSCESCVLQACGVIGPTMQPRPLLILHQCCVLQVADVQQCDLRPACCSGMQCQSNAMCSLVT
jgi:hypothetical protein